MTRLPPRAGLALLAGAVSLSLLLGAFAFQYWGGLAPCEMCVWQRWPHGAAAAIGLIGGGLITAGILPRGWAGGIAALALLAMAVSGAIGVFHAGVEWGFWAGPSACTGTGYVPGADFGAITIVPCDVAQWRLFGISLAGYNALISLGLAGLGFAWLARRPR